MSEYTPRIESVQAIAAVLWRALDDADAPVPTDPAVLSLAARSLLQLPNGLIAQPGDTIVRHRDGTLSLEPMTLPRKRTL